MTVVGTRPEIIRLSRIIPKLDEFFDHIWFWLMRIEIRKRAVRVNTYSYKIAQHTQLCVCFRGRPPVFWKPIAPLRRHASSRSEIAIHLRLESSSNENPFF